MNKVFKRVCCGLLTCVLGVFVYPTKLTTIDSNALCDTSIEYKVNSHSDPSEIACDISSKQPSSFEVKETKQKSETVYVTDTGKCYHKAGCRHLKYSGIAIDKKNAQKQKYRPCKHCFKQIKKALRAKSQGKFQNI